MTTTAKTKLKSKNVKEKSCKVPNNAKIDSNKKCFAKEWVTDIPNKAVIEEVFHRKSERRRFTRDIFLVFEEESNSRKKTRSNKPLKPKFGHLKVDEPIRSKVLLRDIRNKPKCYLNNNNVNTALIALPEKNLSEKWNSNSLNDFKNEKILKSACSKAHIPNGLKSNFRRKSSTVKSLQVPTLESQSYTLDSGKEFAARVNPIFLWAKQDNTRIVEVRCEDYDKRNRICITKTSSGWRAIPRSDPTTSRVLNFYPTPLMKVKREDNETILKKNAKSNSCNDLLMSNIHGCIENEVNSKLSEICMDECIEKEVNSKLSKICKVRNPLATKNNASNTKNKNSENAKKSGCDKILKESKNIRATITSFNTNSIGLLGSSKQICNKPECVINNEITLLNRTCSKDIQEKIPDRTLDKSAGDLQTNSSSFSSLIHFAIPSESKSVYQTDSKKQIFHLCPKTGLFVRNNVLNTDYDTKSDENASEEEQNSEMDKIIAFSEIQITEANMESLEDKTKNLKDLLDDADLLQHCDDNANIDACLIETLVMRSCENNLIQMNDISKTVVNPPKCLSFNEAGEIEGLNDDIFQSNTFSGSLNKESTVNTTESQILLHSTTSVGETRTLFQRAHSCENIESIAGDMGITFINLLSNEIESIPKDLSYKIRETVCPPSESHSQCAVTSSSDAVKSPRQVLSPSESLKNLTLDQIIKLNAQSTQHQKKSIDLETHLSNIQSVYNCKYTNSNNFIETLAVESDENGGDVELLEPLEKRKRTNKALVQNVGKLVIVDQDPDPLTQLRLLIQHTQWKVPDPILVPKDRLSAVLASPAREIPLLITTRPELRLPEAFAYPEIIQNPNILVISMAQLEAILENDQIEKESTLNSLKPEISPQLPDNKINAQLTDRIDNLESTSLRQHQHTTKQSINTLPKSNNSQTVNNRPSDRISVSNYLPDTTQQYVNNSLSPSDINSSTMAVINQMLWLPYLNNISQGVGVENPMTLQEKLSNIEINGITSFGGSFKNATSHSKSTLGIVKKGFDQQFKENEELSLFQKIVQYQMQSILQLNKLKPNPPEYLDSVLSETSLQNIDKYKSKKESSNLIDHQKQTQENQSNHWKNSMSIQEKSYNLRSSVAARYNTESKQYSSTNERQTADSRPRLTCKSLSNLLDPEQSLLPSSSCTALVHNISSDFLKGVKETTRNTIESRTNGSNIKSIENFSCNAPVVPPYHRSCSSSKMDSNGVLNKQTHKTYGNYTLNNDGSGITADTNAPLWHPLFGSNTNTAYSSPWQWTTVTPIGE